MFRSAIAPTIPHISNDPLYWFAFMKPGRRTMRPGPKLIFLNQVSGLRCGTRSPTQLPSRRPRHRMRPFSTAAYLPGLDHYCGPRQRFLLRACRGAGIRYFCRQSGCRAALQDILSEELFASRPISSMPLPIQVEEELLDDSERYDRRAIRAGRS
jgi:hypothetical protein